MTAPLKPIDEAIRAAYEVSPEYDIGEALDGFQVTPGGPLSWSQFDESQPDLAEELRLRVRAARDVMLADTPKNIEAVARRICRVTCVADECARGCVVPGDVLAKLAPVDHARAALAALRQRNGDE